MSQIIQQLLNKSAQSLASITHDADFAWIEAELLLGHVLKLDRARLVAHGTDPVPPTKVAAFQGLVRRRLRQEPMAYLLGQTEFCGRIFAVDKRVLIPRPETEEMVGRAVEILTDKTIVWDVGTGSGAVAVSVKAARPDVTVLASDMSRAALTVAKKNAGRNKAKITFFTADLLNKKIERALSVRSAKHLLILANLPYLPLSDRRTLSPSVTKFEPSSALFTKADGRFLIEKLLGQLAGFQKKNGRKMTILAEFDPPQSDRLADRARMLFPAATVNILQDSCGRDRFLEVSVPSIHR